MSKKIMNKKLHVKNRMWNLDKDYYIWGTIELNDGLPCIKVNFGKGLVYEAGFVEDSRNGQSYKRLSQTRNEITKIENFSCYLAFSAYLIRNNLVRKWKQAGGAFKPIKKDDLFLKACRGAK